MPCEIYRLKILFPGECENLIGAVRDTRMSSSELKTLYGEKSSKFITKI